MAAFFFDQVIVEFVPDVGVSPMNSSPSTSQNTENGTFGAICPVGNLTFLVGYGFDVGGEVSLDLADAPFG